LKKFILYFLFVIVLIFTMPIVFTDNFTTEDTMAQEAVMQYEKADYGDLNTIKLLHQDTGEIEEIDFDTYLYGVVSAEMPANYEIEALRAQAVVARTYTIYQISHNGTKHENANICDSSLCCQAWISKENRLARWEDNVREEYWNKIVDCVDSTSGKYITYQGEPINSFFHSNSGGMTELPVNVWGGSYPYLQVVETSGEEDYNGYSSEVQVSKDELIQKMLEKYSEFQISFDDPNSIQILELTESGRVKTVQMGNINLSGVDTRKIFGLKSAMFKVEIEGDIIKFNVTGYGHGVGLSQNGSDVLAKQGLNYVEIIKHYYKDVEV